MIGKVVVVAFPIALGILLLLPPSFASLAMFAALYGAANGIFTIIRGVAVPDMLTRRVLTVRLTALWQFQARLPKQLPAIGCTTFGGLGLLRCGLVGCTGQLQ